MSIHGPLPPTTGTSQWRCGNVILCKHVYCYGKKCKVSTANDVSSRSQMLSSQIAVYVRVWLTIMECSLISVCFSPKNAYFFYSPTGMVNSSLPCSSSTSIILPLTKNIHLLLLLLLKKCTQLSSNSNHHETSKKKVCSQTHI